jgi:hypothetical protein
MESLQTPQPTIVTVRRTPHFLIIDVENIPAFRDGVKPHFSPSCSRSNSLNKPQAKNHRSPALGNAGLIPVTMTPSDPHRVFQEPEFNHR